MGTLFAFIILEDFTGHSKVGPENLVIEQVLLVPNSNLVSFPILFHFLLEVVVRSFFVENGGYHIQFNVIGKNTLCEAQNNPKNYPGLVVRIAGYPVLFNELSKSAQDDIIARTEF